MLPSRKRFSRVAFASFSKDPTLKRVFSEIGTLKYRKTTSQKASVVISKKVEKSAVKRNLLKRRLYNIFKDYIDKKELSFILYASKAVKELSFVELKAKCNELFKKIT